MYRLRCFKSCDPYGPRLAFIFYLLEESCFNSRDPAGRDLTDLRDSGRIEEDADVVMFVHRPDYYREESKKTHDGLTHLICAKVRDGEQKTVYLKFLGQFSMFEDWVGEIPTAQPIEQKPSRGFGYGQQRNPPA